MKALQLIETFTNGGLLAVQIEYNRRLRFRMSSG
jgi:hypothetical protein